MKKQLLWVFSALAVLLGPGLGRAEPSSKEGNPMGSVGEQHNLYLSCLLKLDLPAPPKDSFVALVDTCGFDAGMTGEELSALYSSLIPEDPTAPMDTLLEPWRKYLSDQQYAYLSTMERILESQTPDEAQASLAELENEAVQSLGRERADLAVLAGLSTARASLSFTTERLAQTGGQRITPSKLPRWLTIVIHDVIGALEGYLESGTFAGALSAGVVASLKAWK